MAYDLKIGRMKFITLDNTFAETVGSALQTVGSGVAPGERAPVGFSSLSVPIAGEFTDADPYAAGMRLRRQARSMFRNHRLRTEGIYLKFTKDSEINGWIACGAGTIEYAEGTVSLSDFSLKMSDVYVLGNPSTSRQGVRLEARSRDLATTPRDYLRTYYAVGAVGGTRTFYLPVGASDIAGKFTGAASVSTVSTLNGSLPYLTGRNHGDSLSFEIAETDMNKSDVVIADRRGNTSPSYSASGDRDVITYGWEEIYGPDHPITSGDVPVIQNDRCRVMRTSGSSFVVQTSSGSAFADDGTLSLGFSSLTGANVVEWTPCRGVVHCSFSGGPGRGDVYIILQRGWPGPQVDVYPQNSSGTPASTSISYSGGLAQLTDTSGRWQQIRLGVTAAEHAWDTIARDVVVAR